MLTAMSGKGVETLAKRSTASKRGPSAWIGRVGVCGRGGGGKLKLRCTRRGVDSFGSTPTPIVPLLSPISNGQCPTRARGVVCRSDKSFCGSAEAPFYPREKRQRKAMNSSLMVEGLFPNGRVHSALATRRIPHRSYWVFILVEPGLPLIALMARGKP